VKMWYNAIAHWIKQQQ